MPTPEQSRSVDMSELRRKVETGPQPTGPTPIVGRAPIQVTQSTVMIASLPAISTVVEGITRQFYGGHNLPLRRVILP